MKTMKLWRIAFVMLAAFSLTSCSNDDEDFDANNLVGTWQKVYDRHARVSDMEHQEIGQ